MPSLYHNNLSFQSLNHSSRLPIITLHISSLKIMRQHKGAVLFIVDEYPQSLIFLYEVKVVRQSVSWQLVETMAFIFMFDLHADKRKGQERLTSQLVSCQYILPFCPFI